MKRFRNAWTQRPLLTTAFAVATLFSVMFAVRSVMFMVYWSDPARTDQQIQGWMTPRYVAQSWHLPPKVMFQALQTDNMPGRRLTLNDIAAAQGISVTELKARIIAAATAYREAR